MKRIFPLLITLIYTLTVFSPSVNASADQGRNISGVGSYIFTKATERNKGNNVVTPQDAGSASITYDIKAEGSKLFHSKRFIRYLTSSWAKASKYTWSKSQSTSLTFSGNVTGEATDNIKAQLGLSAGYTTTYSVAIDIPADSTKFSKLAFGADYYSQAISYVRTATWWTSYGSGSYSEPRKYTTYYEPTPETYLYAVYQ